MVEGVLGFFLCFNVTALSQHVMQYGYVHSQAISPAGHSGDPDGQTGHTGTVFVFILLSFVSFGAEGEKWPQLNSQRVSLAPRELSLVPQTGVRLLD